ncbi:MAG: SH3 domain-containing protein [Sphingomonadaceae bacterium]|nr:SH3 domain-containing protein [Sphingomonadaceae bacterium]
MSTAVATQVMVGSDDLDFDACGGVGVVAGLNPRGDNFLSVRSSPSTSGRELFRLKTGHPVNLCDVSEDGKWLGVVFQPAEDEQDFGNCGVGTPLPRQPYSGPCQQGWVSGRYIELVAG